MSSGMSRFDDLVRRGIRIRRKRLGMSQDILAKRIGRDQLFISRLESGSRRLLLQDALDIAAALQEPLSLEEIGEV